LPASRARRKIARQIGEASECIQAKQALLASTTVQAAELAAMKVNLLCND